MNTILLAIVFAMLLLCDLGIARYLWSLPVLRGQEAFFGRRINPGLYREQGREILRSYRAWLAGAVIVIEVAALLFVILRPGLFQTTVVRLGAFMLATAAGFTIYARFSGTTRVHEIAEPSAPLVSSLKTRRFSDYTSVPFEIVMAVGTIAPILLLAYYYPSLPLQPHGLDEGGGVRWMHKSPTQVFAIPAIVLYLQGMLLLLRIGMVRAGIALPGEHTEEYLRLKEAAVRMTVKLWRWFSAMLVLALISLQAILVTPDRVNLMRNAITVVGIAIGVSSMIAVSRIFNGLQTINGKLKSLSGQVYVARPGDAGRFHAGGLFYNNSNNPALFVESPLGPGYTLNFGNAWSWLAAAYLASPPLVLLWWIMS
ncbi:MAG TPA: hypothetical protein VN345_13595 [Blastocatellia bacterium]|jgi:uncharacterized membrane protein|nr:hypothetical protein [Blastocatellia bacterium]